MTVSHDGSVAVTTSGDEQGMVWELPSGERRHVLTGHSSEVSASILTHKARCAPANRSWASARASVHERVPCCCAVLA